MAFTSTWRQDETRGFRGLGALLVTALAGLLALVLAVMFLWPASVPDPGHRFEVGFLGEIPLRSPVYYEDGGFWLVKLDEQTVVALSPVDAHLRHCRVPWRPDFKFTVGGNVGTEETGWFRDPCSGSTYDLAGNRVFGPSPRGLDRYEVRIDDSLPGKGARVIVIADAEHLTPGASWSQFSLDEIVRP